MAGTVRRIIERIKHQRSGGNAVVALTAETRLVLQGFDPERFDYDTPDDPARLARIREIAREMEVEVADLLQEAEVEPDPEATEAPPPSARARSEPESGATATAGDAAGAAAGAASGRSVPPDLPSDHPLQRFKALADEALAEVDAEPGARSGAPFAVLVKASLLMALYSVTSDRVFCDQLRHSGLYQSFLGLAPGTGYDADAFGEDRREALDHEGARRFFDHVVPRAGRERLFSSDLLQADARQVKGWMTPERSE